MARERAQPRTLRLVLSPQRGAMRMLQRESIEMTALPSDPFPAGKEESGFWYELRDGDDRTLYRRITQNPLRVAAEVLTDDRERPIAREELSEPLEQEFVVHVPDIEGAVSLVLVSSPATAEGLLRSATELARVDLTQPPEREPGPR